VAKISIIGAGNVGATTALFLIQKQIADIILIDSDTGKAKGRAMDLLDFQSSISGDKKIKGTSDYSLLSDSDMVIIAAGRARKKGENITRQELAEKNSLVIREISMQIKKHSPKSIVITITNPVDKMNSLVLKQTGFSREKVIGAGSLLDTYRLKTIIAEEMNISVSQIKGIVKGMHSDQMIPVFSSTTVNGKKISELADSSALEKIKSKIKSRGKQITSLSGSSYYAIGKAAAQMAESILLDKNEIMPASVYLEGEYGISGISTGVLAKIGRKGAEVIKQEFEEQEELKKTAEKMKNS